MVVDESGIVDFELDTAFVGCGIANRSCGITNFAPRSPRSQARRVFGLCLAGKGCTRRLSATMRSQARYQARPGPELMAPIVPNLMVPYRFSTVPERDFLVRHRAFQQTRTRTNGDHQRTWEAL